MARTPGATICPCVRKVETAELLEKVWRGLSKVDPVGNSPLAKYMKQDVWIRASTATLRAHLHRVLADSPSVLRTARMITDADLLAAEFSWKRKKDQDQDESDSRRPVDLYESPALVVLLTGIERKRDWATPGLLLTAILDRASKSAPTWIVDTTEQPLQAGHLSYCDDLGMALNYLVKLSLSADGAVAVEKFAEVIKPAEVAAPAASHAAPAPAELDPVVAATMRRLGIEQPTRRGKGAAGPCQVPGCTGTQHCFLAGDQNPIVGCSRPKCVTTRTVKGVVKTHVSADRYFDLVQEAKQPKAADEDEEPVQLPPTQSQGPQVVAAVAKIRNIPAPLSYQPPARPKSALRTAKRSTPLWIASNYLHVGKPSHTDGLSRLRPSMWDRLSQLSQPPTRSS